MEGRGVGVAGPADAAGIKPGVSDKLGRIEQDILHFPTEIAGGQKTGCFEVPLGAEVDAVGRLGRQGALLDGAVPTVREERGRGVWC